MTGEARHQVFVSSTFRDLVEERRQVMQALLELDCMPAGMELFPASDDDSWTLIQQVIDESDYYIVLVGGRYGSVHDDTGLSYTRMEYEYAIKTEKPVLGFLHGAPDNIPMLHSEKSESAQAALASFRELVARKQNRFWTTPEELRRLVSRSLIRLRKSHPRAGWVRADTNGDLALRERLVELESELLAMKSERIRSPLLEDLKLEGGEESIDVVFDQQGGVKTVPLTWNQLLLEVAPITLDAIDQDGMSLLLAKSLADKLRMENKVFRVTPESTTRILMFMLASGVLERRGHEYRLTQTGIDFAANLQLRGGQGIKLL